MNRLLLVPVLFFSFSAYCQDVIVRHVDGNIDAKVTSVTESVITYTYPGEDVVNTIGKALVSEVRYSSGRVQKVSEMVKLSGRDGWENVIITNNPNDVVGLRRRGEIRAKATGYWNMKGAKGVDRKAAEKLKRESADMGGHVVLLLNKDTKGASYGSSAKSVQSGVAYGY